MTNPVGYAIPVLAAGNWRAILGLETVAPPGGTPPAGVSVDDIAASVSDPQLIGDQTLGPSWTCPPSINVRYASVNGTYDQTDTLIATATAWLAANGVEYCAVRASWGASGPDQVGRGLAFDVCPPTDDPIGPSLTMAVMMSGFGALEIGVDGLYPFDGTGFAGSMRSALGADPVTGVDAGIQPQPWLAPDAFGNAGPPSMPDGYLLRPTALTWDGQDPDNVSNRVIWQTSELAGVTVEYSGTWYGDPHIGGGGGFIAQPAFNVVPYAPITDWPTPVTPEPIPTPPVPVSSIAAGVQTVGIIARAGVLGVEATAVNLAS